MRIDFVKKAVEDHADLSAFNHRLPRRLIAGLLLISLSNLICWPTITFLTAYSLHHHRPPLAAIGGPIVYAITFLCSILGMVWCSGKDTKIFLRWRVRRWVEWLLAHGEPI
jgi:hypothetical protein